MSKKNRSKGKDKSVFVPQEEVIKFDLHIRERDDLTDKQKQLIELMMDKETKIIFLLGPAGSAKTFCAILAALKLLNAGRIRNILYVRTIIESASRSLGSLPGDSGEKMEPFLMPLMDKMEEFLPKIEIKRLMEEEKVKGVPINHLRGASLNSHFTIFDEAQNFNFKELTTGLTRIGRFSKMIVCADPNQSDINGKSGFLPMFDLFNDEESRKNGIHCFSFTKDDIVRSGILRYISERIENHNANHPKHEPMFPPK